MERWVDNFHDDVGITDKMRGLTVAFRTPQNFRVHQNPESELSNWRANDWEDQGSPRGAAVEPPEYELAFDPNAKKTVSGGSFQSGNHLFDLNTTLEEELGRFSGQKSLNLINFLTKGGVPKCTQGMAHRSLHDLLAGKEDFSYVEGEHETLTFKSPKSPAPRNSSAQSPNKADTLRMQQSLEQQSSPDVTLLQQSRLFTERDMMQRQVLTQSFQQQSYAEQSGLSVSSFPDMTDLGPSAWRTADPSAERSGLYNAQSDESLYGIAKWEEDFERSREVGYMLRFLRMVFTVDGSEYTTTLPDENTKQLVLEWASSWLRLPTEQIGVECYHTDSWRPTLGGPGAEPSFIRQQNPPPRQPGLTSTLDPYESLEAASANGRAGFSRLGEPRPFALQESRPFALGESRPFGLGESVVGWGGEAATVLRIIVSVGVGSVRSLPNSRFQAELKQEMTHILSTARARDVGLQGVHLDCYFASSADHLPASQSVNLLQPKARPMPPEALPDSDSGDRARDLGTFHEKFGKFHNRSFDSLKWEREKARHKSKGEVSVEGVGAQGRRPATGSFAGGYVGAQPGEPSRMKI